MPLAQKKLRAETRTITKQFGDDPSDTLTLKYRIRAFTAREQAQFEDQFVPMVRLVNEAKAKADSGTNGAEAHGLEGRSEEIVKMIAAYIERAVTEWDLLGDEDKPVPLNQDSIATQVLPEVLQFVFGMIAEDKAGGKDSPAESPQQ